MATAKTRGGKKKYVVSGCLFGLENEKIHICLYLSSKTTLDKSCAVVAHQDFVFYLFCHDNVPKDKKGLSWIFQGARWSKFRDVKTFESFHYFRIL